MCLSSFSDVPHDHPLFADIKVFQELSHRLAGVVDTLDAIVPRGTRVLVKKAHLRHGVLDTAETGAELEHLLTHRLFFEQCVDIVQRMSAEIGDSESDAGSDVCSEGIDTGNIVDGPRAGQGMRTEETFIVSEHCDAAAVEDWSTEDEQEFEETLDLSDSEVLGAQMAEDACEEYDSEQGEDEEYEDCVTSEPALKKLKCEYDNMVSKQGFHYW